MHIIKGGKFRLPFALYPYPSQEPAELVILIPIVFQPNRFPLNQSSQILGRSIKSLTTPIRRIDSQQPHQSAVIQFKSVSVNDRPGDGKERVRRFIAGKLS